MGAIASRYNLAIIINEQRRGNAVRNLNKDVGVLHKRLDEAGDKFKKTGTRAERFKEKLGQIGRKIKNVLVPALVLAQAAAINFVREGVQEFAQYDKKIKETFTLIPEASAGMRESMVNDLRVVGVQLGRMTDDTVPALYQALSAGIDPSEAVDAVALASKAAIASTSNVNDTMRIGAAIVNAYGGEVYTLADAYDIMFMLIKNGIPKMEEWAGSLQDVISIASESRTPFEDVAAALVVMTRQSDSAAEASELLGFLLMQLSLSGTNAAKAWKEATGQSYREWIAEGKTLGDGLVVLQQHADDTGQALIDMVGGDSNFYRDMQAARGIAELTGFHIAEMIAQSEEFDDVAGSMDEAFITASDNAQFKLDQMNASWEDMKIHIGAAAWETGILAGAIEGVIVLSKILSGVWKEELPEDSLLTSAKTLGEAKKGLEEWADLQTEMTVIMGKDKYNEILIERVRLVARLALNYQDFRDALFEAGVAQQYGGANVPWDYAGDKGDSATRALRERVKWETNLTTQLGLQANILDDARGDAGEKKYGYLAPAVYIGDQEILAASFYKNTKNKQAYNEQLEKELRLYGRINQPSINHIANLAQIGHEANEVTRKMMAYDEQMERVTARIERPGLQANMAGILNLAVWDKISTTKLKDNVITTIGQINEAFMSIFSDKELLEENAGEWLNVITNNTDEILEETQKLNADLTDEEKEHWTDILRSAEEGGGEWLTAYETLQADLTQSQRDELVARVAALTEEQDGMKRVWDGDAEAAEGAQTRIQEAIEAVRISYKDMIDDMAVEAFAARYGGETAEFQLAVIAFEEAKGTLTTTEAQLLRDNVTRVEAVEAIFEDLYTAYSAEDGYNQEEMQALAKAAEVLSTNLNVIEEEALRDLVDAALSESGGFPAIAYGISKPDGPIDQVFRLSEDIHTLARDEPYDVIMGLDKTAFEKEMEAINQAIVNATQSVHYIRFEATYDGTAVPDGGTTDADHHGGISNAIVPSGFPNDSYIVGLTSGERYSVWSRSNAQSRNNGPNLIDNSRMNVNIQNHTAAAAQVVDAQIRAIKKQRRSTYIGR